MDKYTMIAMQCGQRFTSDVDTGCGCPSFGTPAKPVYVKGCSIYQSFPQVD